MIRERLWWWLGLGFALALTAGAWWPWLDPQLNPWERLEGLHDGKNHLLRLYVLDWMIQHGAWYPRWIPDLFMGYGYPVLDYYAPAFYYVALTLKALLGLDTWDGYRAAGVFACLVGAAGCYALATALWRRVALGILAALAALYGPYAFQVNLHRRGDIPEVLGLALIPWLFLAIWRLWHTRTIGQTAVWVGGAALVGAAEILVHNLTVITAVALSGVWVLALLVMEYSGYVSGRGGQGLYHHGPPLSGLSPGGLRPLMLHRLGWVVLAGALAAGLTAFFWLPALGERDAVQLEWLQAGTDPRLFLLHPEGHSFNQDNPNNRQSRSGVVDLHVQYPHQLVATPMLSLSQAALGALAIAVVAWVWLARRAGARTSAGVGVAQPVMLSGQTPGSRRFRLAGTNAALGPASGMSPASAAGSIQAAGSFGALAALLTMALGCWLLTLSVSEPIWTHVSGLRFMQFPSRFMGPVTVCLALAGAGALVWPLASIERFSTRWGRPLSLAFLTLVSAAVLFNLLGPRELPFIDDPVTQVDGETLLFDELHDNLGMGTTSGREFLPRGVYLPTYTQNAPRGRAIFERLYPETDWSGGLLLPLSGDLRLVGWRTGRGTLSVSARVVNDSGTPGKVAIRQLYFPGWRAWLDGRRVPIELAPYVAEQQAGLGFIVLEVPPGEHTLTLAFGPTGLRIAGLVISGLASVGGAAIAAYLLHRQAHWPLVIVVAGWLVVAAGVGYLSWRGVRPMWARFAGVPVAAPAATPVSGVWQSPDLDPLGGGLLVNVAEAARSGQARIDSPSGATLGADRFVDVRQLTVTDADDRERGLAGTSRRQWLYMHPPASVAVDVALPAGRKVWLNTALTFDPPAWTADVGDGVRFQALVARLGPDGRPSADEVALDRTLNPRARTEERRWVPLEVDLSRWAGSTVRVTLKTLPRDDVSFDWAGWGNPVIAVQETARAHPPAR